MSSGGHVRLIKPEERSEADPTPGMTRELAVEGGGLWGGLVRTAPGAASGWHHHGDHETCIFVVEGTLRLESGPGGSESFAAEPGDFIHVPPHVVHREANEGADESQIVVVRTGSGPTTVNVEGPED